MTEPSFDSGLQPPGHSRDFFSLNEWDSVRDSGIAPRFVSTLDSTPELRQEFLGGAALLGLVGRRKTLKPQQLLLADALNANPRFMSVLMPRRSSKTTTLLAWLLGRCQSREDYLCAYAVMTTGKKARDRFLKDICGPLERASPDPKNRPFRLYKGAGAERVMFPNGSILQILGPSPDDFRSDAYDVIVADEGGEPEPETAAEVLAAGSPTQDTREHPMLVTAGTAGRFREGNMLWTELEKGRAGEARHGIIDFSVEDRDIEDLQTWDDVLQLVLDSHPGIDTLTTIEAVEDNFGILGPAAFSEEYLGIFGQPRQQGFLRLPKGSDDDFPAVPRHHRIGISVNVAGNTASMVAAWRDREGRPCILVLYNARTADKIQSEARDAFKKFRTPFAVDLGVGTVRAEVDRLKRSRNPMPRFTELRWPDVAAGASTFKNEIENLQHWNQPSFVAAVAGAKKRGTPDAKMWASGRLNDQVDITPLEAASNALAAYDAAPVSRPLSLVVA